MITAQQIRSQMTAKDNEDFAALEDKIDKELIAKDGNCSVEFSNISIRVKTKIINGYGAAGYNVKVAGGSDSRDPARFEFTLKPLPVVVDDVRNSHDNSNPTLVR